MLSLRYKTLLAAFSCMLPNFAQAQEQATMRVPYQPVAAEEQFHSYKNATPACSDSGVLSDIASGFASKEARFWNSSLAIAEFENIKPVAWRPWGIDLIPRQFCSAHVLINDGSKRRVDYSIRQSLNSIGFGFDVQYCVTGLDRNWTYSPACKMAQP